MKRVHEPSITKFRELVHNAAAERAHRNHRDRHQIAKAHVGEQILIDSVLESLREQGMVFGVANKSLEYQIGDYKVKKQLERGKTYKVVLNAETGVISLRK